MSRYVDRAYLWAPALGTGQSIDGNYLRNLVNDISGQYGCASTTGAMIPFGAAALQPSEAKARHEASISLV